MKTSNQGINLIKQFEGCKLKAYKCPAGIWTCGWGETRGVTANTVFTQEEADAKLIDNLTVYEQSVSKYAGEATQNEFDAMVSLCYNIGPGNFAKSSVARLHLQGNKLGAANSFELWNKGGGKVLPGLVKRRTAERTLYLES